jgi:hypothetical protein
MIPAYGDADGAGVLLGVLALIVDAGVDRASVAVVAVRVCAAAETSVERQVGVNPSTTSWAAIAPEASSRSPARNAPCVSTRALSSASFPRDAPVLLASTVPAASICRLRVQPGGDQHVASIKSRDAGCNAHGRGAECNDSGITIYLQTSKLVEPSAEVEGAGTLTAPNAPAASVRVCPEFTETAVAPGAATPGSGEYPSQREDLRQVVRMLRKGKRPVR